MATITPAITISTTAGVQITMTGNVITYDEFLNILGPWVYKVKTLYYATTAIAQFNSPITYMQYDVNGNIESFKIVSPISPNQYQPSEYIQLNARNIIIDGQSALDFLLLANSQTQLIFYCIRKKADDDIDDIDSLPNNFKAVESQMGIIGFFKGATDMGQTKEEVFPDDY